MPVHIVLNCVLHCYTVQCSDWVMICSQQEEPLSVDWQDPQSGGQDTHSIGKCRVLWWNPGVCSELWGLGENTLLAWEHLLHNELCILPCTLHTVLCTQKTALSRQYTLYWEEHGYSKENPGMCSAVRFGKEMYIMNYTVRNTQCMAKIRFPRIPQVWEPMSRITLQRSNEFNVNI